MKVTLPSGAIAVALAVSFSTRAQESVGAQAGQAGPRVQFSETLFDFGRVRGGEIVRHDFIVTNTGTAELDIMEVKPGCGCTTAAEWDRKIAPGKTGRIPIQFNAGSFNGTVTKPITITCNDAVQQTHQLQIRATVWRAIDVQPLYAYFPFVEGEVTNDVKIIRITSNEEGPVELEAPQSSNPIFQTELKPIKPGHQWELHVRCDWPGTNATRQGQITVKTSSTNVPQVTVNAYVMPQPALMALPQQVLVPAGALAGGYGATVSIRNNSSQAVQITEPSIDAEGVSVKLTESQAGKMFTLRLDFPSGFAFPAGKTLHVTAKTTHPKMPVLRIPVLQSPPAVGAAGARPASSQ
ncbi:MAG TPA: DUF1573 domain-containing protein [Methylomirabilota bacterium]|nr:DUF1573 domain-containing protein [Methylomirabilota bacterium]